ncbi:MAG: hypothetical protein U0R52_10225 [Solirubrobacterales bacterium]
MALLAVALLAAVAAIGVFGFTAEIRRAARRRVGRPRAPRYDPGRERRAELRARRLLRSVAGEEAYSMYLDLGFLHVRGREGSYGYVVYPHRSIVAFEESTGELLSEYCVGFPDADDPGDGLLPDADDVLAKWMALRGDEERLLCDANMHLPGRHLDPGQVRRDVRRLRQWEGRRRRSAEAPPATAEAPPATAEAPPATAEAPPATAV